MRRYCRTMRQKRKPLDALMPRTRQAILAAMLLSPKRAWYRSDLARHLGMAPSSLTRELTALTEAGLLRKRTEGRQAYYEVETRSPLFPELRGLMAKTAGLVDVLRESLFPGGPSRVLLAFVFGSLARGEEGPTSDVDVFVVSPEPLSRLARGIRSAETSLGRPINVSLYSPAEFQAKIEADHHFVRDVLNREKLYLAGDERDLERLAQAGKRRKAAPGRG